MKIRTISGSLIIISLMIPACTLGAQDNNPGQTRSTIVAEVNGAAITLGELQQKSADNLFHARFQYYQAEIKALNDLIDQRLLEDQARRENVSTDELLERHVISQIKKDPTEEQMEIFYESLGTDQPFEAVRGTMLSKLRELRISKARAAYVTSLRNASNVSITLAEPRAEFALDDKTPVRGPRNAPVMVVEFADYQCPYCKQLEPQLEKLCDEFGDKLAIAFKDFPLAAHAHAEKMAEAARCAGEQGKYWELHDFMFKDLQSFDINQIKQRVLTLAIDSAQFDLCLDSGTETAAVKADATEGQHLGVNGTPTIFINGRYLSGNAKYDVLRDMVQQELGAMSSRVRQTAARVSSAATIDSCRQDPRVKESLK